MPINWFLRDPSASAGDSPFEGVISNLGALLWCATAAVCFFCFGVLRRTRAREAARFFLFTGALTLALLIDDFFLMHEYVFPKLFGMSELVLFTGYGLAVAFIIVKFRTFIQGTSFIFLLLALGFFGLSLAIDLLTVGSLPIVEDGAKLLGIVSWLGYFVTAGVTSVNLALE